MEIKDKRFYLIDALRGITLISMVAYHFMYDYMVVYGSAPRWYEQRGVFIWQQTICWSFILISGFVWPWGKKKALRRGLLINALGLLITAVTYFIMPSQTIWFGVLNFMGCAILLMIPLEKPLGKLEPMLGLVLSFMLFMFVRNINSGFVGFGSILKFKLPIEIYKAKIFTPLGFPFPGFMSGDYFPMLPWMLLYICGYYLGRIFERHEEFHAAFRTKVPVLSFIGSKTLWVYMLHQPVNMLICCLIYGVPLF